MAVIHRLKIRSWVQTKTSPTPPQQCTVFVLSSWGQLFVKELDYRYPIRPYVIECVFLALRQWTREGCITSQQDVWLQEQWLQSAHKVFTVFLCALDLLWECTQMLRWVTQRTSLPVTSIQYIEIQEALAWVSPKMPPGTKSACLGQWESDTQLVPGVWSLFSTLQRKCAAAWPRAHDRHKDLLFTEPIPFNKVPAQQDDTGSLPSPESPPFKGNMWFPFPKVQTFCTSGLGKT